MAIVELSKLSVIGLNADKPRILKDLMDLGVVEINNQEAKLSDEEWVGYVKRDGDEIAVSDLDNRVSKVNTALDAIALYDKGKKPFIKTRVPMSQKKFDEELKNQSEIEAEVETVNKLYKEISDFKTELNKVKTTILGLKPWVSYDVPLEMTGTKFSSIILGNVPSSTELETLKKAVSEKAESSTIFEVSSDQQQRYISIVCLKEEKDTAIEELRQFNFNQLSFNDIKGTAGENIVVLENRVAEINKNIAANEEKISSMSVKKKHLEMFHDELEIKRDRVGILSNLVQTEKAFYFDGWTPAEKKEEVAKVLENNGCYYTFEKPEKGEETPVLLRHNALTEPFHAITELYSLPSTAAGDIDPTAIVTPFYILFYGMMLSDAGYGIIMSVLCFIALKKFRLEGMLKRLAGMFFYCGLSTAFWGALFGSWFGNFIPTAAGLFGKEVVIAPLWFDPIVDPLKLLIFSVVLGVIHLFVGMGAKAYMLIRDGHAFDAFCDVIIWYVIIIGLVLFLGGGSLPISGATEVGKYMSLVGAIVIVLTGGRSKKGLGKITGGLGSLYGITSYLADALSYSRLLALGLATGVISQVINTLGSLFADGVPGLIILFIVGLGGHTFNISINALGSFVHTSRLQYVEFFGKFYEGTGSAFNPFNKKTKYVDLIKEEE